MVKISLKLVIVFGIIVVIALATVLILMHSKIQLGHLRNERKVQLLSTEIYDRALSPENYLIFNWNPLQDFIEGYIASQKLNVSVYVLNMRTGASFGINEHEGFKPSSLNKLPISVITLKYVEEEKLSLDTKLPIFDQDRMAMSGTLYAEPVNELSVKELLYRMLAESDNTAAMVLARQINSGDMQRLSSYLDFYDKEESYTFNSPLSVESVGHIFSSLYFSTVLSPEHSEMILSSLVNNSFDINKYANLPDDVIVAHKFGLGEKNGFRDCGILYIEDDRIFYCVMNNCVVDNEPDRIRGAEEIGVIVNLIYKYVVEAKKVKSL